MSTLINSFAIPFLCVHSLMWQNSLQHIKILRASSAPDCSVASVMRIDISDSAFHSRGVPRLLALQEFWHREYMHPSVRNVWAFLDPKWPNDMVECSGFAVEHLIWFWPLQKLNMAMEVGCMLPIHLGQVVPKFSRPEQNSLIHSEDSNLVTGSVRVVFQAQ